MDRSTIKQMPQPLKSRTYYLEEPVNGWWAFITVCPEIALLQIHCHWGTFSTRWDGTNSNFERHLTEWRRGYIKDSLRSWAEASFMLTNQKQMNRLKTGLDRLMDWLWPLFIERLKAEIEAEAGGLTVDKEG